MDDIRESTVNPAVALAYPFEAGELLRTRRKLKKALLADGRERVEKKIAILGGSTTNDIADMLELFLLAEGIRPVFYQSEYAKYWEDAMFGCPALTSFAPDVIYIHTTFRNRFPTTARKPSRGGWQRPNGTFPKCGRSCPQPLPAQLYRTTLNIRFTAFTETAMRLIYTARRTSSTGSTHVSSLRLPIRSICISTP